MCILLYKSLSTQLHFGVFTSSIVHIIANVCSIQAIPYNAFCVMSLIRYNSLYLNGWYITYRCYVLSKYKVDTTLGMHAFLTKLKLFLAALFEKHIVT